MPYTSSSNLACRMDVLGKVAGMSYCSHTNSCLAATILNGAHVFNLEGKPSVGALPSAFLSARSVESYPYTILGEEPLLSSCFLGDGELFALGAATGTVTVVSRHSRAMTGSYSTQAAVPIRGLAPVPQQSAALLVCSEAGAEVIDVNKSALLFALEDPMPRAIAAVALSPSQYAVANYDGKCLLYDTRASFSAHTVLSVPDQITSLTACPLTSRLAVGTVAGRVFTLRGVEGAAREQAFATGRQRAPICSLSILGNQIAAGDIAGRLSLIDATPVRPGATMYWTPDRLLGKPLAAEFAVTATVLTQEALWASFVSADEPDSQVVAIPRSALA